MATASSPAFAAPDGPIATVATGTPFGICTVDSSESSPLSAALHRHADDRQHRVRGHHPGQMRGAAGAGDDHLEAARSRPSTRTRPSSAGVRCADTTRHSCGNAELGQDLVGLRIVSQSDLLPMMTPTSGRGSDMRVFQSHERLEDDVQRTVVDRTAPTTQSCRLQSAVLRIPSGVESPL